MSAEEIAGKLISGDKVLGDVHIHYHAALETNPPEDVVAEARLWLNTAPLDRVPGPAALPKPHRMPLAVNPLFVGREQELKDLALNLQHGGTTVVAAATGMGGVGKTQLASEFVHRYGRFFTGGVFWLSFADAGAVDAELVACGRAMGLPGYDALEFADQVARVRSIWQNSMPRLLVFDNCEDPDLLERYTPTSGGSRVLVTSRRQGWSTALGLREQKLQALPRGKSIELLRKFRPDLAADNADLNVLAEELGDLPLALHVAGSYLQRYADAVTPASYLAQLRSAPLQTLAKRLANLTQASTKHDLDVARTFAISYDRLHAENMIDALALALLARAACFAPGEPIPADLLALTVPSESEEAALDRVDATRRLSELGLIDIEADSALRLHRLLHAFVLATAKDEDAQTAVEDAMIRVTARLNNEGYPALLLALQSHLRYVTDAAMVREEERTAILCNNYGYHLGEIADYSTARQYYERALIIKEHIFGPEHPQTATSLNNLGGLLESQGLYAEALPLLKQALAIRERMLGSDHPDTAGSLNNLARLCLTIRFFRIRKPCREIDGLAQ